MTRIERTVIKTFFAVAFVLYLLLLLYFLFFAAEYDRGDIYREFRYNLVPFYEIKRCIGNAKALGLSHVFLNIGGNVLGFVPLGFLLPIIRKRWRHIYMVIPGCFVFSLIVEVVQLITRIGCFDVDDIILNTLGGIIGYIIFTIVYRKNKNVIYGDDKG